MVDKNKANFPVCWWYTHCARRSWTEPDQHWQSLHWPLLWDGWEKGLAFPNSKSATQLGGCLLSPRNSRRCQRSHATLEGLVVQIWPLQKRPQLPLGPLTSLKRNCVRLAITLQNKVLSIQPSTLLWKQGLQLRSSDWRCITVNKANRARQSSSGQSFCRRRRIAADAQGQGSGGSGVADVHHPSEQ